MAMALSVIQRLRTQSRRERQNKLNRIGGVRSWHLAVIGRLQRRPLSDSLWGAKRTCPRSPEMPANDP